MSIVGDNSIFTAMKQNGPFAVTNELNFGRIVTLHSRAWVKRFCHEPVTVTKYRSVRAHIFDLLQIDSFAEIHPLLSESSQLAGRTQRAYALLANLYAIEGEHREIANRIYRYAASADEVINHLQQRVFNGYESSIEISNEIETIHNPIELLLLIFDSRYDKKVRFEAKRKLVLMGLAASIDQRERETDIENKFAAFLNFLNRYVWTPRLKIGEVETAWLHSTHSETEFSCESVEVIESDINHPPQRRGEREKVTLIKRRLFQQGERQIPVYVSVRKKDAAAKIIKLLRKNEKNPAVAVDDELGLMAVLDSIADIKRFMRHLTKAAVRHDSVMVLEDISDTLTGGRYHATSTGSSSSTPMLKFFARLGGLRVEFIIHTNQTYLNYRYQRGISHDEYEVRRLFDSGVAEFLFPADIYNLHLDKIRKTQLHRFRRSIERE
ncbi:hypothetical protein D5085_17835 [Ectothiorhodospiraceae bacterium BW-2]|nr:hypothetical protein D5085_17835 [Ectothiorhodospiraceae bacterium BW-2]